MSPKLRRIATWVGYPAFYLFCLVLFAYVGAPYERVKHQLASSFNGTDSPLRMEIEDMSWSWLFPGVTASGIRLVGETPAAADEEKPAPAATGEEKPAPPPEYFIDDMRIRVSVLPLLWGARHASLSIWGFGGEIDASAVDSDEARELVVEFDEVNPGEMPYFRELVGLPMSGLLDGELDITLAEGKLSKAEGAIDLEIAELTVGDGKAKIRDTIALPRLDAGTLKLVAKAEDGKIEIEQLSAKGPDLELVAEGTVRLADRAEASLLDVNLRFKFSDRYKNKNDMTRGLFGEPGSNVPGLFDLDPKIKRAKRDDGFYAWRLTGALGRPNFQPGSSSAGGGRDASSRVRQLRNKRTKGKPPPRPSPPPRAQPVRPPPTRVVPNPPARPSAADEEAAEDESTDLEEDDELVDEEDVSDELTDEDEE